MEFTDTELTLILDAVAVAVDDGDFVNDNVEKAYATLLAKLDGHKPAIQPLHELIRKGGP